MNLEELQELQTLRHNHQVKKRKYQSREYVWLSGKHIQAKQNFGLEQKYLGYFKRVEEVENQAYRLKLPVKCHIYSVFYVLFLQKKVTRGETIDQKIVDQLQFEKKEQAKQEIDSIMNSIVFAEEVIDSKPSRLYYFIY